MRSEAPTGARISVTEQADRKIVHVMYYTPERRAPELDIVEDVVPLVDLKLALRVSVKPRQVYLAPQKKVLEVDFRDGYAHTTVPAVRGHQMIVFEG